MRFIPTNVHGILDYASGALFLASPWLFGFADKPAAKWVPLAAGGAALGSSLFTDYELGAVRKIPMPAHLGLDVAEGVLLAAAPWLFGFAKKVYVPHLIFGAFAIGAGLLTQKSPEK
ncbi:SPW repeat domain-containing protein [Spirosoma fluminis]